MNLLALDQASRTSGWAVFSDEQLIASGTFTVSDNDVGVRLFKIKLKVLELIDKYNIDEVIMEDIQMQGQINNVKTFKILAEVFGVLYETFEELNIPHYAVLAVQWRAKLGIKGTKRDAQKKAAQKFVQEKYNKVVSEDESDAICIGTFQTTCKPDYDWT